MSQGQVIGAIVADTQVQAQRAAKCVKVDYEELEPIITIKVSLNLDVCGLKLYVWHLMIWITLYRLVCVSVYLSDKLPPVASSLMFHCVARTKACLTAIYRLKV